MRNLSVLVFLALTSLSYGFHFNHDSESASKMSLLENFKIVPAEQSVQGFPSSFRVQFDGLDNQYNSEFVKIEASKQDSRDIYLINEASGQPEKYEIQATHEFEHYVQVDGNGVATLLKNTGNEANQYRMLGSIFSESKNNVAYEIVPVNVATSKRSANEGFDAATNQHAIIQREARSKDEIANYKVSSDYTDATDKFEASVQAEIEAQKSKRALNGQPITFNVEMLIVTDATVVKLFKNLVGFTNDNDTFSYMQVYYAHLIKLINQRYQTTLATDADLRVNVVLTNFLFLTDAASNAWNDRTKVGISNYQTHRGRDVVLASPTLNAFMAFMNKQTFSFSYDHAVALFNKDIFSDDTSVTDANKRAGVVGFAPVSGVCTDRRYSINEEQAGFINAGVIAHELGHNLGSSHDGGSTGIAASCPVTNNFLMSPSPQQTNLKNQFKFSFCTVEQFKAGLLNKARNGPSDQATKCLLNTNFKQVPETEMVANLYPGLTLTLNDQCAMQQGHRDASFAQNQVDTICVSLWCKNNTSPNKFTTSFVPAVDGSVCGSGKWCIKGDCVASAFVPQLACPFGDDVVWQMPGVNSAPLRCPAAFKLMRDNKISVSAFCADPVYSAQCCQSCQKYKNMACKDTDVFCPKYEAGCKTSTVNGVRVSTLCPRTCKTCTATPAACNNNVCLNGGRCTSAIVDTEIGFKCQCPAGFSGEFCEQKNDCTVNPCQNNGVCHRFGSHGHICKCAKGFGGYDCQKRL